MSGPGTLLTENAVVFTSEGERATVKTFRNEACHSCSASGACHALGGGKEMEVEVLNYLRAKPGDRVELTLPQTSFVKASLVTYLIPLAALLGGAFLGQALGSKIGWTTDGAAIVLAGAGLALSLPIVYFLNRALTGKEAYIPRITRILPPEKGALCATAEADSGRLTDTGGR